MNMLFRNPRTFSFEFAHDLLIDSISELRQKNTSTILPSINYFVLKTDTILYAHFEFCILTNISYINVAV